MVVDIGDLHVKGREWKVEKRRSRDLLLKHGIGKGGKREGRGREEREKKERGAACPNNKKSFPRPWPVSIILAARLKCYTPYNGIRHKADAVKPQIPKLRPKLAYQCQGQVAKSSPKAFAFKTKVTFHNMPRNKRIKGYFAMLSGVLKPQKKPPGFLLT